MARTVLDNLVVLLVVIGTFIGLTVASPYSMPVPTSSLKYFTPRTDPYFPDSPPSCPICAQNYSEISSCAQAAPVLANYSMVNWNPGAFIDVIKCACTDTFQSVFPQCADCFQQTNQSDVLDTPDLPSVVTGMRNVCALASTLLGGVASADGEISSTSSAAPSATASTSGDARLTESAWQIWVVLSSLLAILTGLVL